MMTNNMTLSGHYLVDTFNWSNCYANTRR